MNKFTLVLCISFGLVVVQTSVVTFGGMKECKKVTDPEDFSFMDDCRSDNSKCGFPEIKPTILGDTRIVGGNISRPNSWPWQISLQYMGSAWEWRHLCGGSIINPCYVVTAAHCVEDFITQPSNLRVVAGVHDIRKEKGSIHNVTRVYAHPLFKGSATQWDHDIAVVKVRPPMVFDRNISQICIPSDTNLVQNIAVATGWGYTSDGGKLSDVLRQVELPLIAWEECKPIYPSAINANKLCAGYLVEGGRDTCQGDSGGPLITRISAKYWLTGVTSVGSNCALPKKPGIYTNTAAYKNWLLKFIKDKNECRSNNTNRCEHVCLNTPGSYKCDCCDGYILTEERNCFVECGKPEEMALIMDRNDVLNVSDPLTQPWMVSIRLNATPFEHRCSGVIIASRWILTAASCLVNVNQTVMKANQVIALAGLSTDLEGAYYYYDNNDGIPNDYADVKEFNRCGSDSESDCSENRSSFSNSTEEYEQKLTFTRFKIHEKFLSSLKKKPKSTAADPDDIAGKEYAIALLRTGYPIKFSAFVKPICISLEQAQNDDLCLVPGWRGENILTQKQVLVASRDSCETQTLRNLTKRLICAGNNHDWIQKCDEDLGSPLVCLSNEKMVVSGLSLQRCVPPRSMTVFLHLSYFRDWIVDVVNGNV